MTTFEYINIAAPTDYQAFQDLLTQYGGTGWRFVVVYNGYIFFERKVRIRIN